MTNKPETTKIFLVFFNGLRLTDNVNMILIIVRVQSSRVYTYYLTLNCIRCNIVGEGLKVEPLNSIPSNAKSVLSVCTFISKNKQTHSLTYIVYNYNIIVCTLL